MALQELECATGCDGDAPRDYAAGENSRTEGLRGTIPRTAVGVTTCGGWQRWDRRRGLGGTAGGPSEDRTGAHGSSPSHVTPPRAQQTCFDLQIPLEQQARAPPAWRAAQARRVLKPAGRNKVWVGGRHGSGVPSGRIPEPAVLSGEAPCMTVCGLLTASSSSAEAGEPGKRSGSTQAGRGGALGVPAPSARARLLGRIHAESTAERHLHTPAPGGPRRPPDCACWVPPQGTRGCGHDRKTPRHEADGDQQGKRPSRRGFHCPRHQRCEHHPSPCPIADLSRFLLFPCWQTFNSIKFRVRFAQ